MAARARHRRLASLGEGDLALELLQHPVTGVVLSRRWRSGDAVATPTLDPPDAPPSRSCPTAAGFRAAPERRGDERCGAAAAALDRGRGGGLRAPRAGAARGARVSGLRLEEDAVDVTIDWPTPASTATAPAPYGDKTFDEYGVADMSWWYPRTIPGFGCARGEPSVACGPRSGRRRPGGGSRVSSAWYSCSTAYSNGREAVWHLQAK